ncbi:hypothetical protein PT974_03490 [Cladobotryum mycophilum]|uniref:Nephrocystin 3-like N-terminal domain-containing protein n=1 Tax=Cladobotryum mycophilum TaxID=491253 RepID=A0ABR0SSH0_9HYPO
MKSLMISSDSHGGSARGPEDSVRLGTVPAHRTEGDARLWYMILGTGSEDCIRQESKSHGQIATDVSTQGLSADVPTKKEPQEQNSLTHKPSSSSVTNSLWHIAVEKASVEGREWIREFKETSQNSTDSDGLKELAQLIVKMSSEYTDSATKFEIFGQTIVPRNYIADVVTTLTTIGDVATAFAPPQATAAWSIAKTLLQIPVAMAEQLGAVIGTVELFIRTIRRCQLYEALYNQEMTDKAILSNLHEALLDWYVAAIEFLASSKALLEKGQFQQTLQVIFRPSKTSELISDLFKKEERVLSEVQACELSRNIKVSDQLKSHLNELSSPLTRVDEGVTRLLEQMDIHKKEELLNFISPVKFGNRHQMVQESRVEGTGEWLLNCQSFQDWWQIPSASTVLWLKGTVGTGKTYLTSKAIDYVKGVLQDAEHDEGFAYFYCTRSGASMADPLVVLKSIVQQLSHKAFDNDKIQIALRKRCESAKLERRDLGYKDCKDLILESFNLYSKTTIILDALDETDTTEHNLAQIIIDIMEQSTKPVKVFISSRPDRAFQDVSDSRPIIEINSECQESDIEKYLDEHVYSNTWFKNRNDESKQLIQQTFKSKSKGMFRWVHLQAQTLITLTSSSAIKDWAKDIPENLTKAYDQLLGKTKNPNDLALAEHAIKWVMGSVKAGWGDRHYTVSPSYKRCP